MIKATTGGHEYSLYDEAGEWHVDRTAIAWRSDSTRVAVVVCQWIDPRYFGFDFARGQLLTSDESAIVAARLDPGGFGSLKEAKAIYEQFCDQRHSDQGSAAVRTLLGERAVKNW